MRRCAAGPPALPLVVIVLVLSLHVPGADGRKKKAATKPAAAAAGLPPVSMMNPAGGRGGQRGPQQSETELYTKGTDALNRNQLQEALVAFDAAVAVSPIGGKTNTRVNRGLTLQRLGRYDDALASYDGALSLNSRFLYALYNKGLALRKLGRSKEAVASLREAVAVQPSYAEAHYDLCAALFETRNPTGDIVGKQTAEHRAYLEGIIPTCEAAIAASQTADGKAMAHETKGLILDVLQRRAEATHATATALDLSPSHRSLAVSAQKLRRRVGTAPPASDTAGMLHKLWAAGDEPPAGLAHAEDLPPHDILAHQFDYTPLFLVESASAATLSMNSALIDTVHRMMTADPKGGLVSNIGGWQSRKDNNFLEEGGPDARALHLHILTQVSAFLKALGLPDGAGRSSAGAELEPYVTIREAWANVNGNGNWNHEHNHGASVFAGCYYISSGFVSTDENSKDTGRVVFPSGKYMDSSNVHHSLTSYQGVFLRSKRLRVCPVSATGLKLHHPSSPSGGEIADNPDVIYWSDPGLGQAGTLALWPGTVVHSVPQHTGTEERISIAFK